MSFIEIVNLSCKCGFYKTHLQYDARIFFQPDPFRYTVEARIRKCSHFVIKSESHRQILFKNRNFPRYFATLVQSDLACDFYALNISKVNRGELMAQIIAENVVQNGRKWWHE